MSIKKYVIHCDACGTNIVTDGTDGSKSLVEIKTALIPGGVPTYNAQEKKTETKKSLSRPKMFKCPKCGRGVVARKCFVEESKHEEKNEEKAKSDGREDGIA